MSDLPWCGSSLFLSSACCLIACISLLHSSPFLSSRSAHSRRYLQRKLLSHGKCSGANKKANAKTQKRSDSSSSAHELLLRNVQPNV